MLVGHYSTALIAHQKFPTGSLLYFLIAAQLQDFLWFLFHYLGLETTLPSDIFGATLSNMQVDMLYSHDLLPQLLWVGLVFLFGKYYFKSTKIGLIGVALMLGHFILDFFSGHPHHLFGAESAHVGLGLYASNIYLAIAIEAAFTAIVLWYFFSQEAKKGIQRSTQNRMSIIGLFVFGVAFLLFVATVSFREWFNIPEIDFGFNTNIPVLIMTYIGMIVFLQYFVPKTKR